MTRALTRLHERTGLPLVATNDAHYLLKDDAHAHDVLLVHRHRQEGPGPGALPVRLAGVLPEERRGDGPGLPGSPRGPHQHRPRGRDVRLLAQGGLEPARLRRPRGLHHRELLREGHARRVRGPAAHASPARRIRPPSVSDRQLRGAAREGDRRHPARRLRGLLPDRVGLHPLRAREPYPRGPRPRLGRGKPRGLLPADHRHRPHRVRPHLRAVLERGAHQPPRHRHRLLRGPPRRGHRVRDPEVRPRERGPDHHLRDHEGEGGGARRGSGHGHELRGRRQDREDDPLRPQDDAREGAPGVAAPPGGLPEGPQGQGADRRLEAARGHDPARLDPRRRSRDLAASPSPSSYPSSRATPAT